MLRQHYAGLHDVEVVQLGLVGLGERAGEEVGLLLVVAFEADPVTGSYNGFHQLRGVLRRHQLALGVAPPGSEPLLTVALFRVPICHASRLLERCERTTLAGLRRQAS